MPIAHSRFRIAVALTQHHHRYPKPKPTTPMLLPTQCILPKHWLPSSRLHVLALRSFQLAKCDSSSAICAAPHTLVLPCACPWPAFPAALALIPPRTTMSKPVQGKVVATFIFVGVIAAASLSFNMPSIAPKRRPVEDFDKFRSPYAIDRSSMWKEMDKSIKTSTSKGEQ